MIENEKKWVLAVDDVCCMRPCHTLNRKTVHNVKPLKKDLNRIFCIRDKFLLCLCGRHRVLRRAGHTPDEALHL